MEQRWTPVSEIIEPVIEGSEPLNQYAAQVKSTVHNAVLRGGDRTRYIADVLHGVWMGHPLHPVLTDVTIGAWTFAAVFDFLSLIMPFRRAPREAADTLTILGIASAIPTAAAGIADYSTIKEDAAPHGFLHGLLNSVGLVLYILSWRARRRHNRLAGMGFSMIGMAFMTASAWLGGELVYRHRVGVNHAPKAEAPQDWQAVLPVDDLDEREPQRVDVEGQPVLLYRDGDAVYAISAVCAHAGGPLEEGKFYDGCVECPWHQSVYDLSSGEVMHGPSTYPQPRYEARISNGQVQLRVEQTAG